jgi:hypothetical protein
VVSFTPRPFYPRRKRPLYPLDRSLGGPRSGLDAVVKRKIPAPSGNRTPTVQPVPILTELSRLMSAPTAKARNICSRVQALAPLPDWNRRHYAAVKVAARTRDLILNGFVNKQTWPIYVSNGYPRVTEPQASPKKKLMRLEVTPFAQPRTRNAARPSDQDIPIL